MRFTAEMIKPALISLALDKCDDEIHKFGMEHNGWCMRCGLTSAAERKRVLKDRDAVIWEDQEGYPLGALLGMRYFVFDKERIREETRGIVRKKITVKGETDELPLQ